MAEKDEYKRIEHVDAAAAAASKAKGNADANANAVAAAATANDNVDNKKATAEVRTIIVSRLPVATVETNGLRKRPHKRAIETMPMMRGRRAK